MPWQDSHATDGELLDACRGGRTEAFAPLWERHRRAGIVAARNLAPGLDAEDLVSEAYLKIYELVVDGRGPTGAFRPYLYQVVKSVAADRLRSPERASEQLDEIPDLTEAGPWEDNAFDLNATAQAFSSLGERWQAVLWYTEVEGLPPREAAALLGISPNGVSALAGRAREALQSAWVEAHVNQELAEEACRTTLERLQRYQRGKLTARASREVAAHLEGCAKCSAASREYRALNKQLALVLATLFVGGGSAAALASGFGPEPGAPAASGAAAGNTAGGAAAGTATAGGTAAAAMVPAAGASAGAVGAIGAGAGAVSAGGASIGTAVLAVAASVVVAIGLGIGAVLVVSSITDLGAEQSSAAEDGPGGRDAESEARPTDRTSPAKEDDRGEPKPEAVEDRAQEAVRVDLVPWTDPASAPTPVDPVDPSPPVDPVDPVDPGDGSDPALAVTGVCRAWGYPPEYYVLNGQAVENGVVRARITQGATTVEVPVDFSEFYPPANPGDPWTWASGVGGGPPMIVSLTPLSQWGLVDDDIANVTVELRFIAGDGRFSPWTAIDTGVDCV